MKRFLLMILLIGVFKCYSQDKPNFDRIEGAILKRNIAIDTSKIGSYINFFDIDNHGNGKWVNIYKGYWGDYFGNNYFGDSSSGLKVLDWNEWFSEYKGNNIYSSFSSLSPIIYEGNLNGHKPNGKWIIRQDDDIVRGNFINGKPDGAWLYSKIKQSSDGSLKEQVYRKENYRNGVPDGEWSAYKKNVISQKEIFFNGKPNGECNFYDDKGRIIIQSNFSNGYPNGESYFYDYSNATGKKNVIRKAKYNLGKPIEYIYAERVKGLTDNNFLKTEFLDNSNLVRNTNYINGKPNKTIEFDKMETNFKYVQGRFFQYDYSFGIWRLFQVR